MFFPPRRRKYRLERIAGEPHETAAVQHPEEHRRQRVAVDVRGDGGAVGAKPPHGGLLQQIPCGQVPGDRIVQWSAVRRERYDKLRGRERLAIGSALLLFY